MNKIELNIIALADSQSSSGNFVIILEELLGFRRLPIIIGAFEAQAIAVSLEQMKPNRPLTHDLFKHTLDVGKMSLTEVIITELLGGVFHAKLVGLNQDKTRWEVDSRSSDAIAMAVRYGCPIYTFESVMKEAGVVLDSPSQAFTNKRGSLHDYSLEELQQLLHQVLAKEDYESASRIRDAISKKSKA